MVIAIPYRSGICYSLSLYQPGEMPKKNGKNGKEEIAWQTTLVI
jgi:hypothetical protein